MKTLEISTLTPENFRIFGSYSRLVEPTAPGGGVNGMSFHPDMEILELGGAHAAAFSGDPGHQPTGTGDRRAGATQPLRGRNPQPGP